MADEMKVSSPPAYVLSSMPQHVTDQVNKQFMGALGGRGVGFSHQCTNYYTMIYYKTSLSSLIIKMGEILLLISGGGGSYYHIYADLPFY